MTTLYVLISNKTEITLGFFTSSHNFVCFCVCGVGLGGRGMVFNATFNNI
jgi:hypothetical protein